MDGKNNIIRKHMMISGRVQGVGFRFRCLKAAMALGLTGWVKNLEDGRVELEIQGKEEEIDQWFYLLEQGTFISIEHTISDTIDPVAEKSFRIIGS